MQVDVLSDDLRVFDAKKIPTQVKHFILEKYLDAWGGIIVNANRGEIRLCFVDALCGSGLYHFPPDEVQDTEAPEYEMGSALLGPTKLLDQVNYGRKRQRDVKAKALLINKDRGELETVKVALPSEVRDAVDVGVRLKRFDEVKDEVVRFCNNWFSFVLIDPYGPTPTPYSAVREVVRGRYTDTLINFPFLSLQRWSGYLFKLNLSDEEQTRLTAADAFMGSQTWRELVRRSKATGDDLEKLLITDYTQRLASEGVYVLSLALLFEEIDRVLYHLVFTTHKVAGLAAAKEKFQDAQHRQIRLRDELKMKKTGQPMFGFMANRGVPEVDIQQVADMLYGSFKGQTVTVEDLIRRGLYEPGVLERDVRKALTSLKRDKKATYVETRYDDEVRFSAE